MNLFEPQNNNLLPFDGEVNYYPNVFTQTQINFYFNNLLNTIEWQNDEIFIFGKNIITQRKVAWYAAQGINYSYSNTTKIALPFTEELNNLKEIAEKIAKTTFNACLLNLYHSGAEGMGWHSDNEKTIVPNSAIASFSFGAERKFAFKHKTSKQSVYTFLQSGSLLLMQGISQTHWWHSLPKTKKVNGVRINLTFRQMI